MAFPRYASLGSALAALVVVSVSACGKTVSTSSFSGEQHDVAQAISNFQSDVSGGDEKKVCTNDLAAAVVARLNSASGGCRQVIKNQLAEVESYDLTVDSVQITVPGHAASAPTATTARTPNSASLILAMRTQLLSIRQSRDVRDFWRRTRRPVSAYPT